MEGPQHKPHEWSLQEIADYYGICEETVYRWARSESPPPHIRIGASKNAPYRFNLDEFEVWRAAREYHGGAA